MQHTEFPVALAQQLLALSQAGTAYTDPAYQELAGKYTHLVHGFSFGDVVDIADEHGRSDNMPILVESLELFAPPAAPDPRLAVRLRGPIFCVNAQFDGNQGEGTCRPSLGDKFLLLN